MLNKYRQQHADQSIQFIFLDDNGRVLESGETIFTVEVGSSIYRIHPFFESLSALLENLEKELALYCIHLNIQETSLIADMKIIKEDQGVLLIISDLTEHYSSYQSVAQARNESIIKTELTVIKNNELEERERFKNSFIQNFSHELRNPLTSVMAITDILASTSLTNEQQEMLSFLKDSNTNLRLMLDDILNISSIESGRVELQEKFFSLRKLLKLIDFTYKAKARQKNLEFEFILDEKVSEFVEGDRLRIYQVLTNLLDNALKYTSKGKVTFSVLFNQKWANKVSLRFEISDTGDGLPEESHESVFESFVQLESGKNKNGSGLGLAIVKGLLNLMGSKINVKSKHNEGSIFYFDLLLKFPLKSTLGQASAATDVFDPYLKKKKHPEKMSVLVVEDDERIQTVLLKTLIDSDFFRVQILNDGSDVMNELVNNQYDLILMDINLPNISGDQLTKLIREFPFKNIKNIPIIGLTANAYKDQLKTYLTAGMNKVITKPFEKEELLKTIFLVLK